MTKSQIKFVVESYAKYFGRAADAQTIKDYGLKENGKSEKASTILKNIIADADAEKAELSTSDFVNNAFQNLFGRNATTKEMNKYSKVVDAGKDLPINAIVKAAKKADKGVYDNKIAVANKNAELGGAELDLSKISKSNTVDLNFLNTVTKAADLKAKIDALPENSNVPSAFDGKAFVLTTGVDNITGTAKNDLVSGATIIDSTGAVTTASTFTVVDTIALGKGTEDTFNLTVTGGTVAANNYAVQAANISGLEMLNVRSILTTATNAVTLDASTISGLTSVNSDKSTSALAVKNLATGASFGVKGNGTVVNGEAAFAYATATDAVTLNIADGTKMTGEITVLSTDVTAGATTSDGTATSATINSTGAANVVGDVDLANGTLTSVTINAATNLTGGFLAQANDEVNTGGTVTIKGAASSVELTDALDNDIASIDASGLKGGITATLGTGVTSFKGGAGSDVVTANATTDANAKIDAGAGTDKLVIGTNTTVVDTAAEAARFTNFETLSLNGTLDVSLIAGITAIELSGAGNNISKLSATQAANVTATAAIVVTTIALADSNGTADVLSLTMGDGKGNAFDAGALTINGFETLNVKANGISTSADKTTTIASFVADKLEKINLAGTAVTLTNAATTKAVTIDASALTGNGNAATATQGLTLGTGLKAGSTVIGSSVNDEVTLAAVAAVGSTFNLGAGDDKIHSTVANLRTAAVYNTIDGGAGKDTLEITDGAAVAINLVDDDFKGITNVEAITILDTTTTNQSIKTGGWYDANFKAAGSDITTNATTGSITFEGGTFGGNQTISATTTTGNISITTGSGNDKVTVISTSGIGTVNTGAGDDTIITTNAGAVTITAGAGNDTITLGSAAIETVVLGTTAALNGVDKITGFEFGANKDALQVAGATGFLGAAKAISGSTAIANGIDMGASNVLVLTDIQDLTSTNFGATASNTVIRTQADKKYFIIADKALDGDSIQNMYYVETNASNVATVTLVGTINEGTVNTDNIA